MSSANWELQTNDFLGMVLYSDVAFQREECQQIIQTFRSTEHHEGKIGLGTAERKLRNSVIRWIRLEPATEWIYSRMGALARHANQKYGFDIRGLTDSIQLAEYGEGEYYDWHLDIGSGKTSLRKISISVQLSDSEDYEGGDLEFFGRSEDPPRSMGSVIAFPAFLPHRVTPVTRGTRLSLVTWVSGPSFR